MSPITNCVLTLFQIYCFTRLTENNVLAESKRLLLTDPDVIQGQIRSLETKLQDAFARISTLEQEKQDASKRISALEQEKQNANASLSSLKQNIHDVTMRLGTLEQEKHDVTVMLGTLEQDNTRLKSDIVTLQNSKGTSYIRWGRKDCPALNGTELVYSGLAGGGDYTEKGNGVNYLCLPHDPNQPNLASSIVPEHGGLFAHVVGAEYQFSYAHVMLDDDVPCAVCLDTHATTKMMIPGKTTCPANWRKQYEGLLCSSYYDFNSPSEFECLDINPQSIDGGRANLNGKLFYPAVARCGSLQCPPYENGEYMSCVVCTR